MENGEKRRIKLKKTACASYIYVVIYVVIQKQGDKL